MPPGGADVILSAMIKRIDGRAYDELRPVRIISGFQSFAEGSVLIEQGRTSVVCSVSVEERVPQFLKGTGSGWITAEYSMLPRATVTRTPRDITQGRIAGRSQEIQRLIGRSLRSIIDMPALGERTLVVDCDVLQADGSTRTAAITGSYVALYKALSKMADMGLIASIPLKGAVAAASVGVFKNYMLLDLCYEEDSCAEADFNVVMTDKGDFSEIQGTAEARPFSKATIDAVLALAEKGIKEMLEIQKKALRE